MTPYAPWVHPFLDHLKTSGNMAESCRAVGVKYGAMMAMKQRDADFAAAVDEALEESYDALEAEARRRAFEGVHEPIVHQGRLSFVTERYLDDEGNEQYRMVLDANGQPIPLTVRKYSDSLMQFLLKGYRRRKFGDKQEITGADGGPLQVADESKRAARVAQLMALAQRRKDAQGEDISDLA